ncbi:helix-turn-helix domain-containing protein [Arthrobacter sp. TMT4-20]
MVIRSPHTTEALRPADAAPLKRALAETADVTVFVDGTAVKLPPAARDAVVDVLRRLAAGDAVTTTSAAETLTTSQAAAAAGISHTYLRNLTDAGIIPVEYRGTHRRIRSQDITKWLATQKSDNRGESPRSITDS